MIKALRKNFVRTSMTAVTVFLVALLGAINIYNVCQHAYRAKSTLKTMQSMDTFEIRRSGDTIADIQSSPGTGLFGGENLNERFSMVFFLAVVNEDKEIILVDVNRIASISPEEAAQTVEKVVAGGKTEGRISSFIYNVTEYKEMGILRYNFLDISSRVRDIIGIFIVSLLAGIVGWLVMYLLVRAMSRRTIKPIAENMEKQKRFVTDAGHELKTPLAIIRANTEAMEMINGENKWTRNIKSQVTRLTDLTANLLTLARYDEYAQGINGEKFDLSETVLSTAEMFREPAALKGCSLSLFCPSPVTVRGEKEHFDRLVSVLLDNAVKYCRPGTDITVETLNRDKKAILSVTNYADNLDTLDTGKLFDRFYRGDESHSNETAGYGIGLSAAGAIAQMYKGRLSAKIEGDKITFTAEI